MCAFYPYVFFMHLSLCSVCGGTLIFHSCASLSRAARSFLIFFFARPSTASSPAEEAPEGGGGIVRNVCACLLRVRALRRDDSSPSMHLNTLWWPHAIPRVCAYLLRVRALRRHDSSP